MIRLLKILGISLLLIGAAFYYLVYPKIPILTGYASRMACTCHFVQGRDLEEIKSTDLDFSLFSYVSLAINDEHSISASFLGMAKKIAKKVENNGCILINGDDNSTPMNTTPELDRSTTITLSDKLSQSQVNKLDTLIFDQNGWTKKTRSCIIIHNDSIIYNAHIDGFDEHTPQLGWSMTKSVTALLIGLLQQDSLVSLKDKNLFSEWSQDDRANITLENLLNMNSGLDWTEDYSDVSEATTMLFDADDVVEVAKSRGMEAEAGKYFEYSSGSSNLLSGLMRKVLADDNRYHSYPYERLFRPLGMTSAFIETDEAGNFIASSYMYASAYDWAKLGLLMLHKGQFNGEQVVDSNWINMIYESDPVSGGSYGWQFWHNDGGDLPDCPSDMIYMDGFQGQRVFILPSQNLVIVRLGLDNLDFNDMVFNILKIVNE